MPAKRRGTRRLSEVAKFVVQPSGIVSTGWPAVRHTCSVKLGVEFDRWQDGVGHLVLAQRADGKLAAMVGGVGLSLPRQVGKTYILTGLIFGLCINQPGLLVIWSAHHARTHMETFMSMQGFSKRPKVVPFIDKVYTGSGDEEIRFRNGSRILFGARERGFGRGIPGVDALMMDEAQILSDRALENMLATLNTSQLGLALYVGTPPKLGDNSEAFTLMRLEALSGESTDLVWIECGADDNADPDSHAQYERANPSYPFRTPLESMLRMRKKLSDDGFRHEALGIWDPEDVEVFDLARWSSPPLLNRDAEQPRRVCLVVDVSPDRRWSCIGVAGDVDGKTLVMCLSIRGTDTVVGKIAELIEARDIEEIALFTGGQAKVLEPDFVAAGIEYVRMSQTDMGAACGALQQAVKAGTVMHRGQNELDAAVANARTRRIGENEVWDRREPRIDISPLVAVSGALYRWGMQQAPMPAIY